MTDFLKNRETEIYLKKFTLKSNQVNTDILQDLYIVMSPISASQRRDSGEREREPQQ